MPELYQDSQSLFDFFHGKLPLSSRTDSIASARVDVPESLTYSVPDIGHTQGDGATSESDRTTSCDRSGHQTIQTAQKARDSDEHVQEVHQQVQELPRSIPDSSQQEEETPQHVNKTSVQDSVQPITDTTQNVSETSQPISDPTQLQLVQDISQPILESPQSVPESPQLVIDTPQSLPDSPQLFIDYPQSLLDSQQHVPDTPQSDSPQSVPDSPQLVIDTPLSVPASPHPVPDTPKSVPDIPHPVTDTPKSVPDSPQLVPESKEPVKLLSAVPKLRVRTDILMKKAEDVIDVEAEDQARSSLDGLNLLRDSKFLMPRTPSFIEHHRPRFQASSIRTFPGHGAVPLHLQQVLVQPSQSNINSSPQYLILPQRIQSNPLQVAPSPSLKPPAPTRPPRPLRLIRPVRNKRKPPSLSRSRTSQQSLSPRPSLAQSPRPGPGQVSPNVLLQPNRSLPGLRPVTPLPPPYPSPSGK